MYATIRNPYARDGNNATSRGNLAVFSSSRVSSSVRNTGALLATARGNFSDAAGFFSIIPVSSAHAKNDLIAARYRFCVAGARRARLCL